MVLEYRLTTLIKLNFQPEITDVYSQLESETQGN
jgi:hypothetical protein